MLAKNEAKKRTNDPLKIRGIKLFGKSPLKRIPQQRTSTSKYNYLISQNYEVENV